MNCRHIHDYIGLPLLPIVQDLGLRGIPIELATRDALLATLNQRVGVLDLRLMQAGIENPSSDQKLGLELRALGVPLTAMTPGGGQYKLDSEILGRKNYDLNTKYIEAGKPPRFPFIPDLLLRNKLSKACECLNAIGVCDDGLIRTALKSCHTATARYASSGFGRKGKPGFCPVCRVWGEHGTNLQNISRGCSICGSPPAKCVCPSGGIHIKSIFQAWPGWRLGEWDYSALELRVMAYRICCRKLIERLESGIDLHTLHAKIMFPGLEITTRRRTLAKNFIYAIRGAGGNRAVQRVLAQQGEYIELHEIQQWRLRIFAEYPEIPAWIEEVGAELTRAGTSGERRIIRNAFGRPRVLLGYEPIKEALATEISGTSADIMNCVAVRLAYEQPEHFQYVVLQVHDSWLVHAPEGIFPTVMNAVRSEMERPVWHWDRFATYPVEAKAGERWSDLTAWQEAA